MNSAPTGCVHTELPIYLTKSKRIHINQICNIGSFLGSFEWTDFCILFLGKRYWNCLVVITGDWLLLLFCWWRLRGVEHLVKL